MEGGGGETVIIMLKVLGITIQNLVTQHLCVHGLQRKRKQNLLVVLVAATGIYTCKKCRLSESCLVDSIEYVRSSWVFELYQA
jgi:hypothetical protein